MKKRHIRNFEQFRKKRESKLCTLKKLPQDFLKEIKISNSNPLTTHLQNISIMQSMNFVSELGIG